MPAVEHPPCSQSVRFGATRAAIGAGNRATAPLARADLLAAIEGLIDRAPTLEDLEHQGMQLLAARRWRALGRPVPARLRAQERSVAAISLAAPSVLGRVRAACDADLLLLKGPETAAAYPDPGLRAYGDIDLLASDAPSVQRALIRAGFEPVGDSRRYLGLHHLRPLRPPCSPLLVEVHRAPAWPQGLPPLSTGELIEVGVPARCGVEGILGLPPAHHAVLLAAHAWCHAPLGHLRQLLDIAFVAADATRAELARLAQRWSASRLWQTTLAALDAVFGGGRQPLALRLWARHLASVRERTVLEAHLRSWLSPLWYLPPAQAMRVGVAAFGADLQPLREEGWNDKLRRTRLALSNASVRGSRHDVMLRPNGGADR